MTKMTNKCKRPQKYASAPNKHIERLKERPLPQWRLMGDLLGLPTPRPTTLGVRLGLESIGKAGRSSEGSGENGRSKKREQRREMTSIYRQKCTPT